MKFHVLTWISCNSCSSDRNSGLRHDFPQKDLCGAAGEGIERSQQRLPTQPCKGERAAAGELAIYPARELAVFIIFHLFFLHGFHAYILLFNTSIASLGTDEHIAKIRVPKCPILKFLWDFEICQNGPKVDVGCVSSSSSSSRAAVPPILNTF